MSRMPILIRITPFLVQRCLYTIYAVLDGVSPDYPPDKARLHTCYSPVRRSPPVYCYTVMPLDLHVLSLSLAFILSQDQTLRCFYFFLYSFPCFLTRYLNKELLRSRRFIFESVFELTGDVYFLLVSYYFLGLL